MKGIKALMKAAKENKIIKKIDIQYYSSSITTSIEENY